MKNKTTGIEVVIKVGNVFPDEIDAKREKVLAAGTAAGLRVARTGFANGADFTFAPEDGRFMFRLEGAEGGAAVVHRHLGGGLDPALPAAMCAIARLAEPMGDFGCIRGARLSIRSVFIAAAGEPPPVSASALPYLDDGLAHSDAVFNETGRDADGTVYRTKRSANLAKAACGEVNRIVVECIADIDGGHVDADTVAAVFGRLKERHDGLVGAAPKES